MQKPMTGKSWTSKLIWCSIIFTLQNEYICTISAVPSPVLTKTKIHFQLNVKWIFPDYSWRKVKMLMLGHLWETFLFSFLEGGAEGTPVPKSNIQYCHNHFSYSVMYKAVFSHHFTRKSANKVKWWKGYLKKCPRPPDLKFVAIVTTNGCVKYFPAVQITPENNTSSWKFAQKF